MGVDVMYTRQKKLHIQPPAKVSIIGCGGIGAWVGIDLALAGAEEFRLFDDDTLEVHNLNRLPFSENDVGKSKTEVLKKFIKKMRPDTRIYMHGRVSTITKSLLRGTVVDCTDKLEAQQLIEKACEQLNLAHFRVGYDGQHMTIIDSQHSKAPKISKVWDDGSGQSGYEFVPSWVVPPQVAAAFVTSIICHTNMIYGAHVPINTDVNKLMNIGVLEERLQYEQEKRKEAEEE